DRRRAGQGRARPQRRCRRQRSPLRPRRARRRHGAAGRARRPCGARAAAQRVAHRLRPRGLAPDRRRRGQPPARGRGRRAPAGDPRLRNAAVGVDRLQGRPALGRRRCPVDDGHRFHAGQGARLVRQRVGLREPPGRRCAHDGAM
ncbi:MAG: NAD-dependent glyceraldehyde-3-phosphate dehydrogenase for arsenate detoxification, partial [uncultured Solirubrobacteraceae bacterium]